MATTGYRTPLLGRQHLCLSQGLRLLQGVSFRKATSMARIHEVMPLLMADVEAVGKDHKNEFHKYKYRSVDDLMAAVYRVLTKHKVTMVPRYSDPVYTDTEKGVRALLRLELDWFADDGSSLTTVTYGEGADTGDKAAYKCMAGALKYALLQTLCIPTDEIKDPEGDSETDKASHVPAPKRTKAAETAKHPSWEETRRLIEQATTPAGLTRLWSDIRPDLVQLPADDVTKGALVAAYNKRKAELA